MVKVDLSRKGIGFVEHNISQDREALGRLVGMGYRTTPLTVIGEQKVIGYSPKKLDAALQSENINND